MEYRKKYRKRKVLKRISTAPAAASTSRGGEKNSKTIKSTAKVNSKKLIIRRQSLQAAIIGHSAPGRLKYKYIVEKIEKLKWMKESERLVRKQIRLTRQMRKLRALYVKCKAELSALRVRRIREREREAERYNLIYGEYVQVMSERDQVHKDMEALYEELVKVKERSQQLPATTNMLDRLSFSEHESNDAISGESTRAEPQLLAYMKKKLSLVTKQRDEAILQVDENDMLA
jgi:hypothetical protein